MGEVFIKRNSEKEYKGSGDGLQQQSWVLSVRQNKQTNKKQTCLKTGAHFVLTCALISLQKSDFHCFLHHFLFYVFKDI